MIAISTSTTLNTMRSFGPMALRTILFGAGFTGRGSDEEIVVDMEGSVSQMHDGARW